MPHRAPRHAGPEGAAADDVRAWWEQEDVHEVARRLLDGVLTHVTPEGTVALRLTEVEAYAGPLDPGSHAYRGRSARNATMFGAPGHLYVYRHLGLHHCVNVVCGPAGTASAVLLRAGEVVEGADLARERRRASGVCRVDRDLARGPARLTVALGIDRTHDGADLLAPAGPFSLRLAEGSREQDVATGPRVGVGGEGGRADLYPWRSWLVGEPTVSDYRAAARPRARRS